MTNRTDVKIAARRATQPQTMEAAVYAALGCTEIDFRSPPKLEDAAAQIAQFVKSSAEYSNMLTALKLLVDLIDEGIPPATFKETEMTFPEGSSLRFARAVIANAHGAA